MKNVLSAVFVFIQILVFGQSGFVDVKNLTAQAVDSTSNLYYEKLIYRFNFDPSVMSEEEMKYLYYAKNSNKNLKTMNLTESGDFMSLVREGKCKEAIDIGERILSLDPANLEVLGMLLNCYSQNKAEESRNFSFRGFQFRRLVDAILQNGISEGSERKLTVMAVADEYILSSVLGLDLRLFRRSSKNHSEGIIDSWKKGKEKIDFLVVYDHNGN